MKYYKFMDYERTVNRTINFSGLKNRSESITEKHIKINNNKGSIFKLAYKNPQLYKIFRNMNPIFKSCC